MASEPVEVATAEAGAAAPAEVASPAPAPEVSPAASPAVADAPSSTEVSAEIAPAAPGEKPAESKPAASLLSEVGKEAKPEGDKGVETAAEAATEAETTLPAFEAFTLPEGVSLADKGETMGNFTKLLGELELQGKIPHELMQEHGQKLVDLYLAEQQRAVERSAQLQADTWNATRADWVQQIKDDPIIGRNRFNTVIADAARVRDLFSTPRFLEMLDYTGAGDHPGMIEFCNNVAKLLNKNGLLREGTPVPAPASKGAPEKTSGPRSRYAATKG